MVSSNLPANISRTPGTQRPNKTIQNSLDGETRHTRARHGKSTFFLSPAMTTNDKVLMSSKSPFDRLSDEIDVLRQKIDAAVAARNEALRDPNRAKELPALEKEVEDLKDEKKVVLATRAKLGLTASPPTEGKSQLPTPAFVPAPSSHVHRSLLVRSISLHPSVLCTFKSALCVGSSCVRAESASRLGERDCWSC